MKMGAGPYYVESLSCEGILLLSQQECWGGEGGGREERWSTPMKHHVITRMYLGTFPAGDTNGVNNSSIKQ
jgi:hypothetical protein